jgi:hypothetical protein
MMPVTEQERRRALKRKFILCGIVVGALLSVGYLALNLAGRSITGGAAPPDPIGIRFVNVFLIIAACVLQASILGRVVGFLTRKATGTQ